MYTSTDMVSNAGYYRRIQCGHLFGRKSIVAVQTVNFTGMECREIFTFRVGPPIITGTKGYNFAQITSGGADLTEFNNFESKTDSKLGV
jgi:hypothetical protein